MREPTHKILGLDPGTATTGFGVICKENGKLKALGWGSIQTDKNEQSADRLVRIHCELSKLIQKQTPTEVMVERLFFATNLKTATTVSEARGVILFTLANLRLPYREITPMEVKQKITGNGKADKKMIQKAVAQILGLSEIPKPDDAADALAIALSAFYPFQKN